MSMCEKHAWVAFKSLFSAGTTLQKMIYGGGETHLFLNRQALTMLKNDGMLRPYQVLLKYKSIIDLGNLWADQGLKFFAHYYEPKEGKGILPWISAKTLAQKYFISSLYHWKKGNHERSMFYLGALAHIVQDMCVPHHAMGIPFNGHRKFELWALKNKHKFKLEDGGIYGVFDNIMDLIDNNAYIAKKYYTDLLNFNVKYYNATKDTLHLAQKTTAHLFDYFVKHANDNIY
ncbi:MAG: zinc dependent phospholipase C family protein [Peptococcaceae bacterium]|nr:zinc dependent phospholipase C family protein [Peptococcaceae bacterium]